MGARHVIWLRVIRLQGGGGGRRRVMRRQVRCRGARWRPAELGGENRSDLKLETERSGQDPAQVTVAAAAGKTLYVAFPGEADGEDTVRHGVHRGVAEQHPGDPALALDGFEDLRP
jgi:hypothetical protein